jgi:hypothetical protein
VSKSIVRIHREHAKRRRKAEAQAAHDFLDEQYSERIGNILAVIDEITETETILAGDLKAALKNPSENAEAIDAISAVRESNRATATTMASLASALARLHAIDAHNVRSAAPAADKLQIPDTEIVVVESPTIPNEAPGV